jgi:hypothetical protein
VTLAYLCEGSYQESRPYADFMGYTAPWYSARGAGAGLLAGRGFGWLGCYVRDDAGRVYETYSNCDSPIPIITRSGRSFTSRPFASAPGSTTACFTVEGEHGIGPVRSALHQCDLAIAGVQL